MKKGSAAARRHFETISKKMILELAASISISRSWRRKAMNFDCGSWCKGFNTAFVMQTVYINKATMKYRIKK